MITTDVVVIGAGVAGLTAARAVMAAGRSVAIIEARDRIGGRIWTAHDPRLGVPVELGAEFVHGSAPAIREIAREAAIPLVTVAGSGWTSVPGGLTDRAEFWERVGRVLGRLDPAPEVDRSFAEWVAAQKGLTAEERGHALAYVSGYEGADPADISAASLAPGAAADAQSAHDTARLLGGYERLVMALAPAAAPAVHLNRVVTHVRWRAGEVVVTTRSVDGRAGEEFTARAAVITLPLGVLTAPAGEDGHVAFDPPLPAGAQRAIGGLGMGGAVRVALTFEEPIWMSARPARGTRAESLGDMAFLSSRADVPFAVWWTQYPVAVPMLVGWRGGPRAWELCRQSRDEVVRDAVRSIARLLGATPRAVQRQLRGAFTHDWCGDPYSRGAYSYRRVGGVNAGAALARPIERTLYFAGEHTADLGVVGTVDGAMGAGMRAARALLRVR